MPAIDAKARNLDELLGGKTYKVDYFQREYRWQMEHIHALVDDLTGRFLSAWKPEHPRRMRTEYPSYFLGSVIISGDNTGGSIIDGQQRLTSLSILLIWVYRRLTSEQDRAQISRLIFTYIDGENAYNIDVPERAPAMEALYNGPPLATDDVSESVRNIMGRYDEIDERMPAEIKGSARREAIYCNALANFTLQNTLMLARSTLVIAMQSRGERRWWLRRS